MESVVRARGQAKGGMQFHGISGGDYGQWNCTNPQCRASVGQRSHVVTGVEHRKGVGRDHSNSPALTRLLVHPISLLDGSQGSNSHLGRTMQMNLSSNSTTSKKASQAARKAAAATKGFPTPVPVSKVQALELLKGDLNGELYLELQSRLAKPKVVPPKKKEDALLRKRIEKDKVKDLQARASSHRWRPNQRRIGSGC